jgi:hypothetical protein
MIEAQTLWWCYARIVFFAVNIISMILRKCFLYNIYNV